MSHAAPKRRREPAAEPAPVDQPSPTPVAETNDAAAADVARDEVARRAYEKYAARGFAHGQDANDWLQAETELRAERELEAQHAAKSRRSRAKKRR